ncbi:DNA topoisomerase II beta [Phyllostomus discolor]|uniref:DNA topoisomerase II beta n=1 Tax=Phyllostomus discolor TaxID=89673 RepID=A0A834DYV0_9CHIR|nr:DNA topoisomerase II beta [Phyllostomus discolor]
MKATITRAGKRPNHQARNRRKHLLIRIQMWTSSHQTSLLNHLLCHGPVELGKK